MFEALTAFLPKLQNTQYGEWIIDRENDGSAEHPIHFSFVDYDQTVDDFVATVYRFMREHENLKLNRYSEILESAGIEWNADAMSNADISNLDGKTIFALILGAIRADRFCEGALLEFFENGSIAKWLSRLKEIDQ